MSYVSKLPPYYTKYQKAMHWPCSKRFTASHTIVAPFTTLGAHTVQKSKPVVTPSLACLKPATPHWSVTVDPNHHKPSRGQLKGSSSSWEPGGFIAEFHEGRSRLGVDPLSVWFPLCFVCIYCLFVFMNCMCAWGRKERRPTRLSSCFEKTKVPDFFFCLQMTYKKCDIQLGMGHPT